MGLNCGDGHWRRWRCVPQALVAVCLSACQALPGPLAGSESDAESAEPDALVNLRDSHAACEARLTALVASRDEFGVLLAAQNATLADMQGAMRRVESRFNEQNRSASVETPAPACEPQIAELPSKLLVGRREQVWIEPLQMTLPARIDTGAETASLDARNIEEFERNGKPWVRFDIVHPDNGEAVAMEHEVSRYVRILQSSSDTPERRAVIELGIVMGSIRQSAEFTLSNRSHLDFQVLVGRNVLRDLMIVDVGQSNIAPPRLPEADGNETVDES